MAFLLFVSIALIVLTSPGFVKGHVEEGNETGERVVAVSDSQKPALMKLVKEAVSKTTIAARKRLETMDMKSLAISAIYNGTKKAGYWATLANEQQVLCDLVFYSEGKTPEEEKVTKIVYVSCKTSLPLAKMKNEK